MKSYFDLEAECEFEFHNLGPVYHLWTPENFEVLFTCMEEYVAAMNIVGLSAKLVSGLRLLTFELMSNHFHFTACAEEADLLCFFNTVKRALERYFKSRGRTIDWSGFQARHRILKDLNDVRNVIVYNNRNGFLVCPDHSPFSYQWGANKYFFNPDAVKYDISQFRRMTVKEKRRCFCSHIADKVDLMTVDGCASPVSFCDLDCAQRLFQNASNYFYRLTRSIESQKDIAKEIGESIFYTDDELYSVLCKYSKEKYDTANPGQLALLEKQDAARMLHFEYNAKAKTICRMLRIPISALSAMGVDV